MPNPFPLPNVLSDLHSFSRFEIMGRRC